MSENELPKNELQTLDGELERLTERYRALGKLPGVNKKWLNKTIARLEEASIFAGVVYRVLPENSLQAPAGVKDAACTCPMPGVIDVTCPVHARVV